MIERSFGQSGYRIIRQEDNDDRKNWIQLWNPSRSIILTLTDTEAKEFISLCKREFGVSND